MKLRIRGLEVACVIGERPDERTRLQTLQVDVELEIPDRVAETDCLDDTVDYAALTERIRAALVDTRCRMIERAAKVVCDTCLTEPLVQSVRASVRKVGAVPHLQAAEAVYESRR